MLYVILGETASGKSSAALKICKENGLPLISADAFGVYQGFDIGSAKATEQELEGIENYFINSKPWGQAMTAFDFQSEGRIVLDDLAKRHSDAVIVGGTFLYVKALLFPYDLPLDSGPVEPVREIPPLEEMLEELRSLDPESLKMIDTKNPRRVLRQLELARKGIKRTDVVSSYSNTPLYPCIFIRIVTDRDVLKERIRKRVLSMVDKGLFEEEDRLEAMDSEFSKTFKGIGFKEIYEGKRIGRSREDTIERIVTDTVQYAKRQRTFLRHQFPYMVEIEKESLPDLVREDILKRKGTDFMDIPLIKGGDGCEDILKHLYSKGVRQCGIYGSYDKETIKVCCPLLQIVEVQDPNLKENPKLPKFNSFIGIDEPL